jgi:type I restriction enzyme S subunit
LDLKSKSVLLSEIGEFKNGLNFNQNDYGLGFPIINVKQLYQSRFATMENLLEITSDFAKKIDGYFVERGDLLFVRGSMVPEGAGKLVMVNKIKQKTVFSGFIIRFRITNRKIANPLFLTYLLRSPKYREMFVRIASGSVHSNMNQEILGNIQVELPEMSTQNKIVKILDDLDTEIELLQNQNKILEKIIQSIFKSWFVDFDGVTEFDDSELGKIPKGWQVVTLSEITEIITKGTTPTQKEIDSTANTEEQVNYVRVNCITKDNFIDFDKLIIIPKHVHLGSLKRSILKENDVLYTIAGTIGRISIVEKNLLPANINQAIAIIRPSSSTLTYFIFLMMCQIKFCEELHKKIVQAVQANLSLGTLSDSKLVKPPIDMMCNLIHPIDVMMKQMSITHIEIRNLTEIRDSLLPKLMSGEIRV